MLGTEIKNKINSVALCLYSLATLLVPASPSRDVTYPGKRRGGFDMGACYLLFTLFRASLFVPVCDASLGFSLNENLWALSLCLLWSSV